MDDKDDGWFFSEPFLSDDDALLDEELSGSDIQDEIVTYDSSLPPEQASEPAEKKARIIKWVVIAKAATGENNLASIESPQGSDEKQDVPDASWDAGVAVPEISVGEYRVCSSQVADHIFPFEDASTSGLESGITHCDWLEYGPEEVGYGFMSRNRAEERKQSTEPAEATHREHVLGWDANRRRPGVKGRLLEVVHGCADNDPIKPRTLVVFEWRLIPGAFGDRIKNVRILAAFQDVETGDDHVDPVPIRWAPDKPIHSHFSTMAVTTTQAQELSVQAGYSPFATANGKLGRETARVLECLDARSIVGVEQTYQKPPDDHTPNAVQWFLTENATLRSGVQYDVRTAVLLKRRLEPWPAQRSEPLGSGSSNGSPVCQSRPFTLTVKAEANLTRSKELAKKTLLKVMRLVSPLSSHGDEREKHAGCTAFDPAVEPGSSTLGEDDDNVAARPTRRDWRNLQAVDLDSILVKDWEPAKVMEQMRVGSAGSAPSYRTLVSPTTSQMPPVQISVQSGT